MEDEDNFLQKQYKETMGFEISHNYLQQQFSDYEVILEKFKALIKRGDFTLGKDVDIFESNIRSLVGTKYAIGVGNGTDALFLSMKALGIGADDEVITSPYSFQATPGSIATTGARPVFVDVGDDYSIDPDLIEDAITDKTKAIMPVHWTGLPAEMNKINEIAQDRNLYVIEDACQAISSTYHGQPAGSLGDVGCFSMHPLKNLNIWGDGGVITTDSEELYDKLVLLRNHGMVSREEARIFGYNSRLDTIQAIVANHLLEKLDHITDKRIEHANYFDQGLGDLSQIKVPERDENIKQVYHLYVLRAENRDGLVDFLKENSIDAKVHYRTPLHLMPAARDIGYKEGDFPNTEAICDSVFTLPIHEFITQGQQDYVIQKVREFYS